MIGAIASFTICVADEGEAALVDGHSVDALSLIRHPQDGQKNMEEFPTRTWAECQRGVGKVLGS